MCRPPSNAATSALFNNLATNEAALLPGSEESQGRVVRFRLGPRLTEHVRHQAKYLDMPVLENQAFVFTDKGRPGPRARTLKEFIGLLAALPAERIQGHLRQHDFSRWLADVFRDNALAGHIRMLEGRQESEDARDIAADVAQAIRARYETVAEREAGAAAGLERLSC
jgi:hypothetical protein